IAKMYGVDFEELKQANTQISSPDMIMPGMKIKVPSTSKSVKKEKPVKEKKIKEKETKEQQIKKPTPVIEGDEKEKKKEVKPEMPLPQMPQTPQIPEYPIMKMPTIEQEMKNYTMINMPQTKEKEKEVPKETQPQKEHKKEHKESKEFEDKMPSVPQHVPTPPPMQEEVGGHGHYTHMCPVCCNYFAPVPQVPPMIEGQHCGCHSMGRYMPGQHYDNIHMGGYTVGQPHGHHFTQGYMAYPPMMPGYHAGSMEMPPQPVKPKEDCGCEKDNYQSYYALSPKPSIELTDKKPMNHYPPAPHNHSENYYPATPHFRAEEEEKTVKNIRYEDRDDIFYIRLSSFLYNKFQLEPKKISTITPLFFYIETLNNDLMVLKSH